MRLALCLLDTHHPDVGGLLVIRLALIKRPLQPILAIALSTEFGFLALFRALHFPPGVDFLGDGRRAKLQGYICRGQPGNV